MGRPEADDSRQLAMSVLGNGLHIASHHEDAFSVQEAQLSMMRRLGAPEEHLLTVQGNLANSSYGLGRIESALQIERDVYSGYLKLNGKEHKKTVLAAANYALSLNRLQRFEEAKALLRKTIPIARRALGDRNLHTLKMRWAYAGTLHNDPGATLDDHREAVTTLEDAERIARRVLGAAHPNTKGIELALESAREALREGTA